MRATQIFLTHITLLCGMVTYARAELSSAPSEKQNFHIYLLMGQSNMAGRGALEVVPQADEPHILALSTNGEWVVARDPLHEKRGRTEPGVGPGMSFARAMLPADTNITIGLVPCAVGGTALRHWVKGGDLYEQAVSRARLAAQAGVIKGVLWHQGEADSDKQENAESYETRLAQMLKDLREDLGAPGLPVVVGQLGEFLSREKFPFADTVRTAIKHISSSVSQVGFADSVGLDDKGDKVHFNTEAQKELGVRYAKAMRGLLETSAAQTQSSNSEPAIIARIALVGDSTVASKSGWGDAFGGLLAPEVKCLNLARAGRSSKSYRDEGHWKKVLAAKPDWILIQFGHNDQPGKGPERETDTKSSFRENLTRYISEAKAIGAKPVLVTSLTRRNFNAQGKIDPEHLEAAMDNQKKGSSPDLLNDYVLATRAVAAEQGVPLIDLNARSVEQMNQLGPKSAAAFDIKHTDKTHLSAQGATETAKLVADEIRKHVPELAKLLKP